MRVVVGVLLLVASVAVHAVASYHCVMPTQLVACSWLNFKYVNLVLDDVGGVDGERSTRHASLAHIEADHSLSDLEAMYHVDALIGEALARDRHASGDCVDAARFFLCSRYMNRCRSNFQVSPTHGGECRSACQRFNGYCRGGASLDWPHTYVCSEEYTQAGCRCFDGAAVSKLGTCRAW